MRIQEWVEAHSADHSWCLLQVDIRNAFNSVDRASLFNGLSQYCPELMAWSAFCYRNHSLLFAEGEPITSEQGVQQGDPLGPLLFAMAWQLVVEKLPQQLHMNLWYVEDGHIITTRFL